MRLWLQEPVHLSAPLPFQSPATKEPLELELTSSCPIKHSYFISIAMFSQSLFEADVEGSLQILADYAPVAFVGAIKSQL